MDELLKTFFSVKEKKSYVPTVETGFPPELHEMAKKMIKSNMMEYTILPIYDIIILNLEKEKQIENIMGGLYNLAKYPLCLFLDPERPEFHQIRTFSGFYTYEIKEKLDGFDPILESFGYRLEGQIYKLDQNKLKDPNFPRTLATISCELLLAYEELSVFNEMRKMVPKTIPTQHFRSQKELQLSRRPSDKVNPSMSTNDQMPDAYPPNEIESRRLPFDKGTGQYENPPGHAHQGYHSGAPHPVGMETHGTERYLPPTQNPDNAKYGDPNKQGQYNYLPSNSEHFDPNPTNYHSNNPPKAGGDGVTSNYSGKQEFTHPNSLVDQKKKDYTNKPNSIDRDAYQTPTNPELPPNNDPKYTSNPEQSPHYTPPIPPNSQFANRSPAISAQNLDHYQNAGQMHPNPNFQSRDDPSYAPRSDPPYRSPPQIPPNSQSSDPNFENCSPNRSFRDASRNPPTSESQIGIEPNYASNPDQLHYNTQQMPSNYQFTGHNPENYPEQFRRNSSQTQPTYKTPESIDQHNPELSNRNPGSYPPISSVSKQTAGSLDDQRQYDMRRGEQLGRDAQHPMPENPPLAIQHSNSRDASGNEPPSRLHETSINSLRDVNADEHPNTAYSGPTIQDPTSNAPHVHQHGGYGMEQQAIPHTPISIDNSGHKIPPPFNPNASESERMAEPIYPQGKLDIYSSTPRGIDPGSSNQTQVRNLPGLGGIDENSARRNIAAPETLGGSEYTQNYGETKNKPIIPLPTQLPDRMATTSAFKKDATSDLYETHTDPPQSPILAPNVPPRHHTEHANSMQNERVYANSEEINRQRETNQGYATHGPTPANPTYEKHHQVDQRAYGQGAVSEGSGLVSGPQQVPIEQHPPYEGGMEQFDPRRGMQEPQGQTPGNVGQLGRTCSIENKQSPQLYVQTNNPERQGFDPKQLRTGPQLPLSGGNPQFEPTQRFSGYQEPQVPIQGNLGQTGGGNYPERHPQDQRSSLTYGQENMPEVSQFNSGHQQAPMVHQPTYSGEHSNPRQQHSGRQEMMQPYPTAHPNPRFPQQPPQTTANYQAAVSSQQAYQHGGNPPQADNYSSYMTNIPPDAQGYTRQPHDPSFDSQTQGEQYLMQQHGATAPYQATGQLHSSGTTSYTQNRPYYSGDVTRPHDSGAYQPTGQQAPRPGYKPGEGPHDQQRRLPGENNTRDFSQPVGPNPRDEYGHNMQNIQDPYRGEQRPYPSEGHPSQPQRYPANPDDIQYPRDPSRPPPEQRLPQTSWECKHCTFENTPDKNVCEICSKSRDFNLDVPATTHMRKCDVCQKLNSIDEKQCRSCMRQLFDEHY